MAGPGGTKWLDDLAARGIATALGGNGYPLLYTVPASALVAVLKNGPPEHSGPLVLGDDYVVPAGWTGKVQIDMVSLDSLDPGEILLVEAWDQS